MVDREKYQDWFGFAVSGPCFCAEVAQVLRTEAHSMMVMNKGYYDFDDVWMGAKAVRRSGIKVIVHERLCTNLSTAVNRRKYDFSIRSLVETARLAEQMGACCVVFHPGTCMDDNRERAKELLVDAINIILNTSRIPLSLELMTQGKNVMCREFDELQDVLNRVGKPQLGICLDTAHLYASGYDIANNLEGVMCEIENIIGMANINCVHLNDSAATFHSYRDVHAPLGYGDIGTESLIKFASYFRETPVICETVNRHMTGQMQISLLRENE